MNKSDHQSPRLPLISHLSLSHQTHRLVTKPTDQSTNPRQQSHQTHYHHRWTNKRKEEEFGFREREKVRDWTKKEEKERYKDKQGNDLAQLLVEAQIPFKIHIVKGHDMKERLCLRLRGLDSTSSLRGAVALTLLAGIDRRQNRKSTKSKSWTCIWKERRKRNRCQTEREREREHFLIICFDFTFLVYVKRKKKMK